MDHGNGFYAGVCHNDGCLENYSYTALRKTRECVIAIPTVDIIDQVVGVGTCSGADTDKLDRKSVV